jgi:hypothetical protein
LISITFLPPALKCFPKYPSTTLAGFVLIPLGLFGKTAFAAERVLGNVTGVVLTKKGTLVSGGG